MFYEEIKSCELPYLPKINIQQTSLGKHYKHSSNCTALEQSDHGLHCLYFSQHVLNTLTGIGNEYFQGKEFRHGNISLPPHWRLLLRSKFFPLRVALMFKRVQTLGRKVSVCKNHLPLQNGCKLFQDRRSKF